MLEMPNRTRVVLPCSAGEPRDPLVLWDDLLVERDLERTPLAEPVTRLESTPRQVHD